MTVDLLTLVADPRLQTFALVLGGWLLKVAWDLAVRLLRLRGRQDVDHAEAALRAALATPDAQDDAVAKMALQRAKDSQEFLDTLAEALEQLRPPSASPAPAAAPVAPAPAPATPAPGDTP